MSNTQHKQLLRAGWRYDAAQDRYAAPGSPSDGTEQWCNLAAAWQQQQARAAEPTKETQAGRATPIRDARVKEPE